MAEAKASSSLAARLKKARAASAVLAKKTDELNETLSSAEEALAGLKLGVSAYQVLYSGEGHAETRLYFERYSGRWCLTITELDPGGEDYSTTELLKASRDLRVEAARRLPDLVDRLLEESEAEIVRVDTSITKVRDVIKDLKEATS